MITLNLLPDIKKDYLKSQRVKRLFLIGATLVSAAFITIVVLLAIYIFGAQQLHLRSVQSDIDEAIATLQSQQDLDKIVTIQKQLEALPALHDQKPAANRLFEYLGVLVPQDITLSKLEMKFNDQQSATITGEGPDPKTINVFVDTLKNATFTYDGNGSPIKPFSKIVLDNVTVDEEITSYRIQLEYDRLLFDNTIEKVELIVPNITSSTSVQERPTLFQESEIEESE